MSFDASQPRKHDKYPRAFSRLELEAVEALGISELADAIIAYSIEGSVLQTSEMETDYRKAEWVDDSATRYQLYKIYGKLQHDEWSDITEGFYADPVHYVLHVSPISHHAVLGTSTYTFRYDSETMTESAHEELDIHNTRFGQASNSLVAALQQKYRQIALELALQQAQENIEQDNKKIAKQILNSLDIDSAAIEALY